MIVETRDFNEYKNLMAFYKMDVKHEENCQIGDGEGMLITPKFVVVDKDGPYFFLYKCHEEYIAFDEWKLLMHVCQE